MNRHKRRNPYQSDTDTGAITLHLVCVTIDIHIVTGPQSLTIQGIFLLDHLSDPVPLSCYPI